MKFLRRMRSAVSEPRLVLLLVVAVAATAVFVACGGDDSTTATKTPGGASSTAADASVKGTVSIEGSSTVQPYTIDLIDKFKAAYPNVTVNPPSGKGSGAGITAFINKQVDVAQSSRQIKADETAQATTAGLAPFETHILDDALAIVVHPSNTATKLTFEQVAKIFAGQITDWSEVGAKAGKITIYTRNEESGSFSYMHDDVIQKALGATADYSSDINKQANAPAGLTAVAGDPSGIFYAGLGNLADIPQGSVKVLQVSKDAASTPVTPSEATVKDKTYPIARGLYYYTNGDPSKSTNPAVKAFVAFALSAEGQKTGEDIGFVPIK